MRIISNCCTRLKQRAWRHTAAFPKNRRHFPRTGGISQEQESKMSLDETWRRERGIVRRQIVIDCGIYDPEKLDKICAVVDAHDGASDADLAKAVFAAFPNATLGVILAACHLISNGWQSAKDAA
jgi:hypothetical protein